MDEGIFLEFESYDQLAYFDNGREDVMVFLNGNYHTDAEVYTDRGNDNREYICINNEIVYLDTIKKITTR